MQREHGLSIITVILAISCASHNLAGQTDKTQFKLPPGFEIERVAGPPLIHRPICADFDEQGRLYIVESNGSNEDVRIQQEKKPHQVVRLEDTNNDGRFDRRTIFAREMAFPEGAMWLGGSLYVAAPPEIWKLTDVDNDGVADRREVWFDGKTLGHCANDLHGPFLGPDGWIYWCKGAWAEQTYERPGRNAFVTRASHIFRRHPRGGLVEPVMTGGMDNPVEVVFTETGDRIFSTTFLQHPAHGKRDGLIHAIYGGLYGKDHGVLEGHLRTGELMPILTHLGAAAPCGLVCLESDRWGTEFRQNLFTCCFNMHKLTRHVLSPQGGSYRDQVEDFLVSSDLDFHPTDVLEDADGSLIVVDTGGWYKLCCPTSQLYKPDIFGAVYRVRRRDALPIVDPRGLRLAWSKMKPKELAALLQDTRHVVRRRAQRQLVEFGETSIGPLRQALQSSDADWKRRAVWTLSQVNAPLARQLVRSALRDAAPSVRRAAANSTSLWRDKGALDNLLVLVDRPAMADRRAATEALGRLKDPRAVDGLLKAARHPMDRATEHALIFALIEIGAEPPLRKALADQNPATRRAAVVALDQLHASNPDMVAPYLTANDPTLRETGWWLLKRHTEWSALLSAYFRQHIIGPGNLDSTRIATNAGTRLPTASELTSLLARSANDRDLQLLMAEGISRADVSRPVKQLTLKAMARCRLQQLPEAWANCLTALLARSDDPLLPDAVAVVQAFAESTLPESIDKALARISTRAAFPKALRLRALVARYAAKSKTNGQTELTPETLHFVCDAVHANAPVETRALAVDVLASVKLTNAELAVVAEAIEHSSPTDAKRMLGIFGKSSDAVVGATLLKALQHSKAIAAIDVESLTELFARFGPDVARGAGPLLERLRTDNHDKLGRMKSILDLVAEADPRNGQKIFHGTKAACSACHQMGYLGGRLGPDLSRIGRIRNPRDILEAIMYPNTSFVRSYEPVMIATSDGKVHNGIVRDETRHEVVLALDAQRVVRIKTETIEERKPGKTSIMPAGLDKQLAPRELADLIKFLITSR